MKEFSEAVKPRLYLDIDGVIISEESPYERVELNAIEKYAPEVVRRLGQTGLELVWLSTWGREASYLSEVIEEMRGNRILEITILKPNTPSMERKAATLTRDQRSAPAPFVWVDDMITARERKLIPVWVDSPHLLIQPDGRLGLAEDEVVLIEEFAKLHRQD